MSLFNREGAKEIGIGLGLFVLTAVLMSLFKGLVLEDNPGLTDEKVIEHILQDGHVITGTERMMLNALYCNMISVALIGYGVVKGIRSWFK